MVDGVGTTAYTYSLGDQVLREDGPFASDTVTNTYVNRLRTSLALQQPTGVWTNKFVYDLAGRLTNVTSPAGVFGYLLGAAGPASPLPKKLLLPNTSYITNTFDTVARLTSTILKDSGNSALDSAVYGYNQDNQRTAFTNAAGTYVQYGYDRIGQLKLADSSVNTEDRGYAYDASWNLTSRTNNGITSSFTNNSLNELTGDTTYTYTYDNDGNPSTKYSASSYLQYAFDDENRLVSVYDVLNSSFRTDFVYDGLGRLRRRLEYTNTLVGAGPGFSATSASWTLAYEVRYVYDGKRVIQERDGSDVPQVAYTRGTDLSGTFEGAGGIGGLLGRSHGYSGGNWSTHNFYHADGNGNITYVVNASQLMAASYRYDPFGNTISKSGSLADGNVYRFSSKELHVNSGLYYYLYRFYDPQSQRWLNREPAGEVLDYNLYRFTRNARSAGVDRDGRSIFGGVRRWWEGVIGKGGCALGMGVISRYGDMPKGGDRYAHCMASCRIKKHCGNGTAATAGFMKEVYDLAICLATWNENYCYSAFQKSDFADNKMGRSCPPEKSCQDQCNGLIGATEPPGGPFEHWPPKVPEGVIIF